MTQLTESTETRAVQLSNKLVRTINPPQFNTSFSELINAGTIYVIATGSLGQQTVFITEP